MKIDKAQIKNAHRQIASHIHRTPVLSSNMLNKMAGCELFFKCENFQKTGSFKARGALFSVLSLSAEQRANGVATHSSGNHGQALAWAAAQNNIQAFIVMPENAPKVKVAAVKAYGAEVIFCTANLASRESELKKVQENTGALFIPPYDYEPTIAGQATCAKELLEDYPKLDAIIAPVGGGGLLAGTCLSGRFFSQGVAIYGAEPSQADDAYRSLKSGERVSEHDPNTIADGLRTTLGKKTFPIILERVADILLVSEEEIIGAMRLIWERLKIIVEPSCAVPLASVLNNPALFEGKKVGLVLSGGNVDLKAYFDHLERQTG